MTNKTKTKKKTETKLIQAKIDKDVATEFHVVAKLKGVTMRHLMGESCRQYIQKYKMDMGKML